MTTEKDDSTPNDELDSTASTTEGKMSTSITAKTDTTGTTEMNTSIAQLLGSLYSTKSSDAIGDKGLITGLNNLNSMPMSPSEKTSVHGKAFEKGVMGFRRSSSQLLITIACGKAQVRYIELGKYIAMIEKMKDEHNATVMLQNFTDQDDKRGARGQVLGRINAKASAIQIIQGLTGRVIHGPADIALFDVYYLDRAAMTSFYIAAKEQIGMEHELENMIAAYEGWKAFQVPLNPFEPYGE